MRVCYDTRWLFLFVADSLVLSYTVNATMASSMHDYLLSEKSGCSCDSKRMVGLMAANAASLAYAYFSWRMPVHTKQYDVQKSLGRVVTQQALLPQLFFFFGCHRFGLPCYYFVT